MDLRRATAGAGRALALLLAAACAGPAARNAAGGAPRIELELGIREDGSATLAWSEARAVSLGHAEARRIDHEATPLTPGERAWYQVLERAVPGVEARCVELAEPFEVEPVAALVVAGNRTSRDAFGWNGHFVGIDLEAFLRFYGEPDDEAVERMTRILEHEYVHLLTWARDRRFPFQRDTPFSRALWTLYLEGLGDYYSLSERWIPGPDGVPTPVAAEALARLEPVFVERLEALLHATPAEEVRLRESISMGRFDAKWGSLPVALWLRTEAARSGEAAALSSLVHGGPPAVLPLAARHAAPALRSRILALDEAWSQEHGARASR